MSRPRGFLWECGSCGAVVAVRNAAPTRTGGSDTCRCAHEDLTVDYSGDPVSGMVAAEMGWCGCGNAEDIDRWMVDYLGSEDDKILKLPEGPAMMLGYVADDLAWTEHGGSVYVAWLTDDGREALVNLRSALERFDAVFAKRPA